MTYFNFLCFLRNVWLLSSYAETRSWFLSKFFIYQLMHKRIALKRILKFTLKQLRHVSVQSPSSGSALLEL